MFPQRPAIVLHSGANDTTRCRLLGNLQDKVFRFTIHTSILLGWNVQRLETLVLNH